MEREIAFAVYLIISALLVSIGVVWWMEERDDEED